MTKFACRPNASDVVRDGRRVARLDPAQVRKGLATFLCGLKYRLAATPICAAPRDSLPFSWRMLPWKAVSL